MKNIFSDRRIYSPAVAAASAVLFVSLSVGAATTISTDISTGGTLTVTGATTLGNNVTIPAGYSLDTAAAGQLNIGTTTANAIVIGQSGVMTRVAGLFNASSTALITGQMTVYASSTLQATQLATAKVGNGTTHSSLLSGYCNIESANIQASTTATFACGDATNVVSGDKVFVQATSSLPSRIYVQSANSTTTAGTIEVNLYFDGSSAAELAPGDISLNYWVVR